MGRPSSCPSWIGGRKDYFFLSSIFILSAVFILSSFFILLSLILDFPLSFMSSFIIPLLSFAIPSFRRLMCPALLQEPQPLKIRLTTEMLLFS